MNTLLHLVIDAAQITNDVAFRGTFNSIENLEYASGAYWIKTSHSPREFLKVIAPHIGTATPCIFRVTPDWLRDAVVDANSRAWLAKAYPGVQLQNTVAA